MRADLFKLILLISAFLPVGCSSVYAGDSWGEWQTARSLYDNQKFEEAYAELKAHERDIPSYYYNLGTISFKLGKIGPAVAYLEKANRLLPHDGDIQYNLSIARTVLKQSIGSENIDPSSSWSEQLSDRVTLEEARATVGFFGLIVVLLWIRAYLATREVAKALLNPAGMIGIIAFALTCGVYGVQRWAESTPPAICLERDVIRSGPGEHFVELARVDAGSKLRLMGPSSTGSGDPKREEVWSQVKYSSDGIGWIKSTHLLPL